MTTFTTIRDLTQHIEPLLGSEADPAIVERLAYAIWGNSKPGDDFEVPEDLADLYIQAESVHAELSN